METRIIKIDSQNRKAQLTEAAKCVDSGGLVAFPTETVYGIAASASHRTLTRLDKVKQRSDDKRYTLHIGSVEKLSEYIPHVPLTTAKLIKNLWPGPLTVILELSASDMKIQAKKIPAALRKILYIGNTIGFRCPANKIACEFLNICKSPVVAPSANRANQPPAVNAQQTVDALTGLVDIILDAGPCLHKKSSSIVKFSPTGYQILRDGAYPEKKIIENLTIKMLFVCTGNTCRSPIAEAIAKKALAQKLSCDIDKLDKMGYKVGSAGVAAADGIDASPESTNFCQSRGADVSSHLSRPLTAEMIKKNDYIFVMCQSHYNAIMRVWPDAIDRCILLDPAGDLADPIGGDQRIYDQAGLNIEQAVVKRISELIK